MLMIPISTETRLPAGIPHRRPGRCWASVWVRPPCPRSGWRSAAAAGPEGSRRRCGGRHLDPGPRGRPQGDPAQGPRTAGPDHLRPHRRHRPKVPEFRPAFGHPRTRGRGVRLPIRPAPGCALPGHRLRRRGDLHGLRAGPVRPDHQRHDRQQVRLRDRRVFPAAAAPDGCSARRGRPMGGRGKALPRVRTLLGILQVGLHPRHQQGDSQGEGHRRAVQHDGRQGPGTAEKDRKTQHHGHRRHGPEPDDDQLPEKGDSRADRPRIRPVFRSAGGGTLGTGEPDPALSRPRPPVLFRGGVFRQARRPYRVGGPGDVQDHGQIPGPARRPVRAGLGRGFHHHQGRAGPGVRRRDPGRRLPAHQRGPGGGFPAVLPVHRRSRCGGPPNWPMSM